jgi:trimethylamine--corrinoid protein Co-methyltransferase
MSKLVCQVLNEAEMERVHQRSLDVLEQVGVRVGDAECRQILVDAGARLDGVGETVYLPRELVQQALATAPAEFELHRSDGKVLPITGRRRYFGSLVLDPWVIDYATQKPRRPVLSDVERHTRLGDALPNVDFLYRMDMPPADVPESIAYIKTLEVFATHTTKHLMAAPATAESANDWMEIAEILADGASLAERRVITLGAPVRTPLQFDPVNATIVKLAARSGLALAAQTEPVAGTTAPLSFAGDLLMGNAENLFLVVMTQLLRAGAPIFYSSGNALTDLATGNVIFYNADKMLWKLAISQMADFYGLPIEGESTGSMVGRYDVQAGIEYALLSLPTVTAGRGLYNGLGSCYNACGMSAEFIVIQSDLLALGERLAAGMDVSEEKLAFDSIAAVGPGGHFLEDPFTIKMLRAGEFYTRGSFDRLGERSANDPADSMLAHAHARAEELMSSHQPAVPAKIVQEIQRWSQRRQLHR